MRAIEFLRCEVVEPAVDGSGGLADRQSTAQSSDECGLGDIGLVTVVHDDGDELWQLARTLGGRTTGGDQARRILIQASRARMDSARAAG